MRIVTRAGWRARQPKSRNWRSTDQIIGVCYHHTAGPQPSLTRSGPSILREIQTYHMDSRGYRDIAYHAIIGPSGKIYEGRPIEDEGAHSDGTWQGGDPNFNLLGICFLGNFEGVNKLTDAAKQSALALEYIWGMKLRRKLSYCDHQMTKATACPGGDVHNWVIGRG